MTKRIYAALCLLIGALPLAAQNNARFLPLDQTTRGSVSLEDGTNTTRYQLIVRDDVFSLNIRLSDAEADLDLYLYDGRGDLVGLSELTDFNESLTVSRISDPALSPGRYELEVVYPFDRRPSRGGRVLNAVSYTIQATASRLEPVARLVPGRQVTGRLLPETGMATLYELDVPRGMESLRIDVSDTDADVDLFLFYQRIPVDIYQADYLAQTLRSSESIILSQDSVPPLRSGTYLLLVLDQIAVEEEATVRLSVTEGDRAPRPLRTIPEIDTDVHGLSRALLSTVEVLGGSGIGGSGTLISKRGHILTNWHVVAGPDGLPEDDITIGMSLDHTRPPVELFTAKVLEFDADRDLALLRITSTRYGDPSDSIELPFVEIRHEPVSIAEELQFIGYPGVGGTGSRASITYTQGVVAGFQHTAYGYEIKTDGEINSGNSGGAALDADYRLIGIPTSIVGEDSGQIAYVVPVSAIPNSWFRYLE